MDEKNLMFDNIDLSWMNEQSVLNPTQYFSFIDGLFEPRFSVGQVGISRQELQYWRQNGLIGGFVKNSGRTWVKVSFFDYCWLKLIAEMRSMFIPIEYIKKVKEVLFYFDKEALLNQTRIELEQLKALSNKSKETIEFIKEVEEGLSDPEILNNPEILNDAFKRSCNFILVLTDLIRRNSPACLIIDKNGITGLILLNEFVTTERLSEVLTVFDESFTSIRLNNLLDEFYTNPRIKETHIQDIFKLTDKERKILSLLRKEGVKEVRVRIGKAGKGIVLVEVVEEKDIDSVKEKLKAILDKGKVQNIKISTFEGNLLLFEETTKIKF